MLTIIPANGSSADIPVPSQILGQEKPKVLVTSNTDGDAFTLVGTFPTRDINPDHRVYVVNKQSVVSSSATVTSPDGVSLTLTIAGAGLGFVIRPVNVLRVWLVCETVVLTDVGID
jgi:hypothetical protein